MSGKRRMAMSIAKIRGYWSNEVWYDGWAWWRLPSSYSKCVANESDGLFSMASVSFQFQIHTHFADNQFHSLIQNDARETTRYSQFRVKPVEVLRATLYVFECINWSLQSIVLCEVFPYAIVVAVIRSGPRNCIALLQKQKWFFLQLYHVTWNAVIIYTGRQQTWMLGTTLSTVKNIAEPLDWSGQVDMPFHDSICFVIDIIHILWTCQTLFVSPWPLVARSKVNMHLVQ